MPSTTVQNVWAPRISPEKLRNFYSLRPNQSSVIPGWLRGCVERGSFRPGCCCEGHQEIKHGPTEDGLRGSLMVHSPRVPGYLQCGGQRFCKEVVAWRTLKHPNILALIGVVVTEGTFAMISHWMSNGNIREFVKANPGANRFKLVGFSFGILPLPVLQV